MKKIFLVITAIVMFYNVTKSQINMASSTGNIAIGDVTDPGVFKLNANYGGVQMLGCGQNGYGDRLLRLFSNSTYLNFSVNAFSLSNNLLITRLGINYDIDGGNSVNAYARIGSKKAPAIEMNAEDGSISLFGENGTGNDYRTPFIYSGVHVSANGYVGIAGITNPASPLDVNGSIAINGVVKLSSDARLKQNIKSYTGALNNIQKLRGVTYMMKNLSTVNAKNLTANSSSDTSKRNTLTSTIDTAFYNRSHIGFIAQELQQVFPELVYVGSDSMLKVDYISLIPVLVESMKEMSNNRIFDSTRIQALESKLLSLETQLSKCCGKSTTKGAVDPIATSVSNEPDVNAASLSQNVPNPFNQTTKIGYYLPSTTNQAVLYIYNMNGNQIKSISIIQKGNGSITIIGSELQPGMYIYTLVADGKEVDTKRMILTN